MKRIIRTIVLILAGLVVLALGVDAIVGISQPALEPGAAEGVLRTFGEDGKPHENRLVVVDDGGTLWIQSGHHLRGWYHRLLRNPQVELVRDGEIRAYHAVPLDTPETESRIKSLLKQRNGTFRFYLIRALLLFADVKPVQLDPRGEVPAAQQGAAADTAPLASIDASYRLAAGACASSLPVSAVRRTERRSLGGRKLDDPSIRRLGACSSAIRWATIPE